MLTQRITCILMYISSLCGMNGSTIKVVTGPVHSFTVTVLPTRSRMNASA